MFTSMNNDGTKDGYANKALLRLSKLINIPIIASGGISNINNVKVLYDQRCLGISGVIIGKAIYEGQIDLKEALENV